MDERIWILKRGEGPLVAVALHHGHGVRPDVADALAIDEASRRLEEDPYTGVWTAIAPTRVVATRSRFEVDLNRPRDEAVYAVKAWGREVWKGGGAPPEVAARSLREHDAFYAEMGALLREKAHAHGRFVVLDLHSYNHRREGPGGPQAPQATNPDVNLGTGSLDRTRWGKVADAFLRALQGVEVLGRRLDVRENIRFQGGGFSRWVHRTFPEQGCALAVEVKKFFMDEWSGRAEPGAVVEVREALGLVVDPVLGALGALQGA